MLNVQKNFRRAGSSIRTRTYCAANCWITGLLRVKRIGRNVKTGVSTNMFSVSIEKLSGIESYIRLVSSSSLSIVMPDDRLDIYNSAILWEKWGRLILQESAKQWGPTERKPSSRLMYINCGQAENARWPICIRPCGSTTECSVRLPRKAS